VTRHAVDAKLRHERRVLDSSAAWQETCHVSTTPTFDVGRVSVRQEIDMDNGRVLGIVLLVIGLVLLIYGLNATHSVSSEFSKLFQGAPSDKSIWLILAGGVIAAMGLGQSLRGRSAR
jgi:hypothetical protein